MDVDGEDDSGREFPTPEAPIDAEGQEHRQHGARLRQTEQQQFGLGEDEEDQKFELRQEHADDTRAGRYLAPFGTA